MTSVTSAASGGTVGSTAVGAGSLAVGVLSGDSPWDGVAAGPQAARSRLVAASMPSNIKARPVYDHSKTSLIVFGGMSRRC